MLRGIKKRLATRNDNQGVSGEETRGTKSPGILEYGRDGGTRTSALSSDDFKSPLSEDPLCLSSSSSSRMPRTVASSSTASTNSHNSAGGGAGRMVAAAISKAKQASALKSSRVVLVDEPTQLTPAENQLFKFDTCVDAADALTASSGQEAGGILPSQRLDGRTGLSDCSVLVSPEGDLLLIPGDPRQLFNSGDNSNAVSAKILQADTEESPTASAMSSSSPSSLFSELMLHAKDDYASSVFLGTDLAGDRALNRFSSKGWSITATSISVRQTCQAMQNAVDFCEQLAHHRKRAASRIADAFEALQLQTARLHGTTAAPMPYGDLLDPQRPENSLEPISLQGAAPAATLTPVPTRVGPLVLETCSLRDAWQGVTSYYSMAAQQELKNWNRATSKVASHPSADSLEATTSGPRRGSMSRAMGLVESLRAATASLNDRAHRRQSALEGAASRVRQMEQRLAGLKQIAAARWDAVFVAEDLVTQRVEALMQERSREREKQRMEQLRVADESTGAGLGATSEEIWSIVSTVAENMEDGSFEPLDMPEVPLTLSRDQSTDDPSPTKSVSANGSPATDGEPSPPLLDTSKVVASANASPKAVSQPPPVSREMIEMEVGLPELRAAAMAADEAVADGADAFMNMLTTLDTTRRSARIAADTAIVSACNAQAECIRQLLQLERQSLEERLKQLGEVEKLAEKIDVRSDLDRYISVDKVTRGGTSHLGDDDDGGIASALAILSRHIDGSMGSDHMHRMTGDGVSVEDDGTTSEMLMIAFDRIFQKDNPHLSRAADPSSEEVAQERYSFEDAVSLLCTNISKAGPTARARRSTICYLLNAKRSAHAEIATPIQFRALCRLFSAILTGCNAEAGGVSNAKMCIMLAQTFYVNRQGKDDGLDNSEHSTSSGKTGEASTTREHRIYVKSYLKSHPIWENDDFWDHALGNQITESLTHSGVMSNFEKGPVSNNSKERKKSEWTETRKMKWYDLNSLERTEAASQVQAVVFAQLGALAHSMMELGCGLQRSCAFVRRMAIRHQLPNSQRTMLLQHLMNRNDLERQEDPAVSE